MQVPHLIYPLTAAPSSQTESLDHLLAVFFQLDLIESVGEVGEFLLTWKALLSLGPLGAAAALALLRALVHRRRRHSADSKLRRAELLLREMEKRVNELFRKDEIGWGRTAESEIAVIADQSQWGSCSGRTVHIPRAPDWARYLAQGLRDFWTQNSLASLRRFLVAKHKRIVDQFHTDYLIKAARIEEVCGSLRNGPSLPPKDLDPKLYGMMNAIRDLGLERFLLLEAKDQDLALKELDYSKGRAQGARRRVEETFDQLANGRDGRRKGRDGRRNFEVTGFSLMTFQQPTSPEFSEVASKVEPALERGLKSYISYRAGNGHDPVLNGLASSSLAAHCRDVWREPAPGSQQMLLSFVRDKAAPSARSQTRGS